MKPKLTFLNSEKLIALLLGVLLSLTLSAQVVVPDSLSLYDDITAYSFSNASHADGPALTDGQGGWAIENTGANDWFEFQIITMESGQYALTLPVSSKREPSKINVSVYKVDSTFVMNGVTTPTYNGQWNSANAIDYVFQFDLEAGEIYNLRVTLVDHGCNIFTDGVGVDKLDGPIDATLKDITIGGVSIPGFSPDVLEYNIALEPDEWVDALAAEANDPTATVEIPEINQPDPTNDEGVKATASIKCTSLGGIILTYKVNIVMPTEVFDDVTVGLNEKDIFFNHQVAMKGTKINSTNNNSYVEYYIYSAYDDNIAVTLECTNGYLDSESYLNVSTLAMNDSTWTLQDKNTQYVPITYKTEDPTAGEWNKTLCTPNNISYIIQLKEYVPVRLRIYCITNKGTAADISGISFNVVTESIDNTLNELTVNGVSIPDFNPDVTNYTIPLPAGATSVDIGATANDETAQGIEGIGTVDIFDKKTTAEVTVTSEAGYQLTYRVNMIAAMPILVGDTLALGDDSYTNSGDGVRVSNAQINWFADSMYVEYFIYSETDADMHLTMLASNGNNDTVYSKVNISTYTPGNEWTSDGSITKDIMRMEVDGWTKDFALEEEYNISLVANEATILRLTSFTNAPINVANIFKLTFGDGHTTAGGEDDGTASIDEIAATNISVITSKGSLAVIGDETMLNASVKIFDISGCLVVNQVAQSSHESYDINQSGIYIVRVVSPDNAISTIKCMVR